MEMDDELLPPLNVQAKSQDMSWNSNLLNKTDKELKMFKPQIKQLNDNIHTEYLNLEVYSSEDENNVALLLKKVPRSSHRNLFQHSRIEIEELFEKGIVDLKRKKNDVSQFKSEDFLIGFEEQSGKAVLSQHDTFNVNKFNENSNNRSHIKSEGLISEQQLPLKKCDKKFESLPQESHFNMSITNNKSQNKEDVEPNKGENIKEIKNDVNTFKEKNVISSEAIPKKINISNNEFFRKPFLYGWKRELVWRANLESSKDKADVYFIAPGGKKLRSRSDIIPLLEGDLTIDNFCFIREPLGVGPEWETVRSAKPSSRASATAATLAAAPPATTGKRISKPKVPKGASPPPQGWTPTRALKVNNAALGNTGLNRLNTVGCSANFSTSPSISVRGINTNLSKLTKNKKFSNTISISQEPCTIMCTLAGGKVPKLQCVKCLCLFHHECVALSESYIKYAKNASQSSLKKHEYVCENCLSNTEVPNKLSDDKNTNKIMQLLEKDSEDVPQQNFPQTITVIKGRKYVMVAKPIDKSESTNDIEIDLQQINESVTSNHKKTTATDTTSRFKKPTTIPDINHPNQFFANNFFSNVSFAYDVLLSIFKYLKIHERPRAASVCKLWYLASKDTSLWHTVRMKNSKINNWAGFITALKRGETRSLDLRKMLVANTRVEEFWNDFSCNIGSANSLEAIDLCRCSSNIVERLFQSNKNLRILNASSINDDYLNLQYVNQLRNLKELRLRTNEPCILNGNLDSLMNLCKLTHLSLTAVRDLGLKGVEVLGELSGLLLLELGECGDFDDTFVVSVLPKLHNLNRLRLENGQKTGCCALKILQAISNLKNVSHLELINFDIKPGFDMQLAKCKNICKLLIIPTYISQSATTNHIILNAVQQIKNNLLVFTWGVTIELLRVTALYVDQCEESTKKEKHHFDECIPVLKPVPGAYLNCVEVCERREIIDPNFIPNEVPQIEILPLDRVEVILGENLPLTKYTIVKIPYHATCRQQLME